MLTTLYEEDFLNRLNINDSFNLIARSFFDLLCMRGHDWKKIVLDSLLPALRSVDSRRVEVVLLVGISVLQNPSFDCRAADADCGFESHQKSIDAL